MRQRRQLKCFKIFSTSNIEYFLAAFPCFIYCSHYIQVINPNCQQSLTSFLLVLADAPLNFGHISILDGERCKSYQSGPLSLVQIQRDTVLWLVWIIVNVATPAFFKHEDTAPCTEMIFQIDYFSACVPVMWISSAPLSSQYSSGWFSPSSAFHLHREPH